MPVAMRPFISFFGGKWAMSKRLGPPRHDLVIEPFAGSAGYSVFHEPKQVLLIERNEQIFGVWDYLIRVSPEEIMRISVDADHVDELKICQEAKWLVGFWFNRAAAEPRKQRSKWVKQWAVELPGCCWSERIRERIAYQVPRIKHWRIVLGSWEDTPDLLGHWHIDPPYEKAGKGYKYHKVNYQNLAAWSKQRRGFVQVCEAEGANWLPFEPFASMKGTEGKHRSGRSSEVLYTQGE